MVRPDNPTNPMGAARRLTAPQRQKRFYDRVEMREEEGGYTLHLDGKRAMTPGRQPLAVPHRRLAEAISAEWQTQGESIDPSSMPVTRLANSAIDGVAERAEDVQREVLAYATSDLLCYRAEGPAALVERQSRLWNPIVAWAEHRFGSRFVLAAGVIHVEQPADAMASVAKAIGCFDDPFRLAGLLIATTLAGSALIALALAEGALDEDSAWEAAHVDEDWNVSQWGDDAEAAERRARRRADFHAAALALRSEGGDR